jgi:NADPH-dependent 2,4-dienoyl-CoA reductase/sulfur reductase-like enzyme
MILTTDPALPYARPPLSKEFLRGDTDDVALHPVRWFKERSIELVPGTPVEAIDATQRCVAAGATRHRYRSLVLASGARPASLPVPGGDRALQLRSWADAERLRQVAADVQSAVIIGAGFIGCEAAASLAMRGLEVTVVAPDAAPQTKRLGAEAGERLLGLLTAAGVRYRGGVHVEAITPGGVALDDGTTIDAGLVLAATGVQPASDLARSADLQVDQGRVVVGADMATSAEGVYAAGDVALAYNATARRPLAVEHWGDALDQGAVAGVSASGATARWDGVPGFWTTIGETTAEILCLGRRVSVRSAGGARGRLHGLVLE